MPPGLAQFVHKDFMTSPLSLELYNNYAITFKPSKFISCQDVSSMLLTCPFIFHLYIGAFSMQDLAWLSSGDKIT